MQKIIVKRAQTPRDIEHCTRIRCSVFADECHYLGPSECPAGIECDGFDLLSTTTLFLASADDIPVGTLRLGLRNLAVARRCSSQFGFSMETSLRLARMPGELPVAEISRAAVLPAARHAGIMRHLYFACYMESLRRGVTHWVGIINMETDDPADAETVCRILAQRGMLSSDFGSESREPCDITGQSRFPLFDTSVRDQVKRGAPTSAPLPRVLRLFAETLNARYFGAPFFLSGFRMFAMPIVVPLRDFANGPYGVLPMAAAA